MKPELLNIVQCIIVVKRININNNVEFDINGNDMDKLIGKRKLLRPDYNYIKNIHPEGEQLYIEWIALLDEFNDIMATHQYDRRMLKIEPVKLGLKPDVYANRIYTPQHNLSQTKISNGSNNY